VALDSMDLLGQRKKKGPFDANFIINSDEAKVIQVFTRGQEKPVALLTATREDHARQIGVEGALGVEKASAGGRYETTQRWNWRMMVWPENISGVILDAKFSSEMTQLAERYTGSTISSNIPMQELKPNSSIPISGAARISVNKKLETKVSGEIIIGHGV